jgi:molybdopterin molybdotransferase
VSGHIRSSNHLVLAGLVRECGAEVVPLGIARDDPAELERRIRRAAECDVLLTSGGVSVGDHDHVQDVLLAAGFRKIFWRVASSPGKPLLFGRMGNTLVFGLPGNPVSSAVAFGNFVRPALWRLHGIEDVRRPRVTALAETELSGPEDRRHFARVELTWGAEGWRAREVGPHGSGNLRSLVNANALAVLPEGTRSVAPGEPVEVILPGGILVRPAPDPQR